MAMSRRGLSVVSDVVEERHDPYSMAQRPQRLGTSGGVLGTAQSLAVAEHGFDGSFQSRRRRRLAIGLYEKLHCGQTDMAW